MVIGTPAPTLAKLYKQVTSTGHHSGESSLTSMLRPRETPVAMSSQKPVDDTPNRFTRRPAARAPIAAQACAGTISNAVTTTLRPNTYS